MYIYIYAVYTYIYIHIHTHIEVTPWVKRITYTLVVELLISGAFSVKSRRSLTRSSGDVERGETLQRSHE